MGLHAKLREYGIKKNRRWRFLPDSNTEKHCFNLSKRSMHGNSKLTWEKDQSDTWQPPKKPPMAVYH